MYKVRGKILTLAAIDAFERINLKCNPETAIQLRDAYEEVTPGYHMNKKHWNTVRTDRSTPDRLICHISHHTDDKCEG
ncbi:MAG: MmcQ/YjbR family DNA-binding protein [Bacteroidota bacterium]